MKPAVLEVGLTALDALTAYDAVCLLITEDERPLSGAAGYLDWRLCGSLSRVLKAGFFSGAPGERLLLPTDGRVPPPRLFAVGLGASRSVTPLGLEHGLRSAATVALKAQATAVALALPRLTLDPGTCGALVCRGFCEVFPRTVGVFADRALRAALLDA